MSRQTDIAIIGAGPAGTTAATMLQRAGIQTTILERATFPRFVIGESLLPQTVDLLDEAGLLDVVQQAGFQRKTGAHFHRNKRETHFHFADGFTESPGITYQVKRDRFDQLLAEEAIKHGTSIHFGQTVHRVSFKPKGATIAYRDNDGNEEELAASFVLDASGFGRVLPRLLDLEAPSAFPDRVAIFAHIKQDNRKRTLDHDTILIAIHPDHHDIWYWVIPFEDGSASIGVVGPIEKLQLEGHDTDETYWHFLRAQEAVASRSRGGECVFPPKRTTAYARNVKQLVGPSFALLGNAAEFLDPVFSSGVTIALKSATLAARTLIRQRQGEEIDWQRDFVVPLQRGTDTFRTYVKAWYDGTFQQILFHPNKPDRITGMLCSILAGYVWDNDNPYVAKHERRLRTLAQVCQPSTNP